MAMGLARSFKGLVRKRAASDPAVAAALLTEAISLLQKGEVGAGTSLLRACIAATAGLGTPEKVAGL